MKRKWSWLIFYSLLGLTIVATPFHTLPRGHLQSNSCDIGGYRASSVRHKLQEEKVFYEESIVEFIQKILSHKNKKKSLSSMYEF